MSIFKSHLPDTGIERAAKDLLPDLIDDPNALTSLPGRISYIRVTDATDTPVSVGNNNVVPK